jgi:hypothetical protein
MMMMMTTTTCKPTRRLNLEIQYLHIHDRQILKFILCVDRYVIIWMKLIT